MAEIDLGASWLLSQTTQTDPLQPWLTPLFNLGGFGLLLLLLLIGRLWPKASYDEMRLDRDAYKQAWQTERDAHVALQKTVETVVGQGELTNKLLTEIKAA